ncbi:unnamed protein product [Arabidopsis thaliana]|uniref:Reverse transcriptase zinc-binding domain-containing protein n=1 Tax=Arabidopsis thaliana TaxID=3702 RepID=A0A5S9Y364_ARATH|nr:unnamed protein product [Arabidopsis thaliana]
MAREFVVCKVGSGITCNFWSENWTNLGPLIHLTGDLGPKVSGLPRNASVADALRDGVWWINGSRSRNPIIQLLKNYLPLSSVVNLQVDAEDDLFMWKVGGSEASVGFSSAATWIHLNPVGEKVDWHKAIWFKGRIPKHAFISWVNIRHRLPTRHKLLSWGLHVPSLCLLCNAFDETRQHLFFDCVFAGEIWNHFTSRAHVSPPPLFEDGVRWLKNPSRDKNVTTILRIAHQATVYTLWRERNTRLHTSSSRPAAGLIVEIKNLIRTHLDPLSRAQRIGPNGLSYLATWFGLFI